jgi:7-carboxy-7-deazaguanine synthase
VPTEAALEISELFYSIQGESTYAGLPCVFIRLSGCNLRCSYCDSTYTFNEAGQKVSLSDILIFTNKYPQALVELTGGEPLLQQNSIALMAELISRGRRVLLETNGSLDLSPVPAGVIKIMDLKCPGSGMCDQMLMANLALLKQGDEIKFVLSSRSDYEWAKDIIKQYDLDKSGAALLFSAVEDKLRHADLADWILKDQLMVRQQLQLHKIIWPNVERGV